MSRRLVLGLSIGFNIIFIAFLISKRFYYHQLSVDSSKKSSNDSLVSYTVNKYQYNRIQVDIFKMLPHSKTDIVFLGTSLTQGFPLQEIFKNCRLENRGIGGNTITDISNRLYEVTDGHPAKLFLEMGTNDIGNKVPIDTMLNHFKKIIETVKKKTPSTKIYVQSVLPFGKDNIKEIELYNHSIEKYCSKNHITYINMFPLFLQKNSINPNLTTDGTHLNSKGYFIWAEKTRGYIDQ